MRQGYRSRERSCRRAAPAASARRKEIDPGGAVRYENFYQVDMRIEKQFTFGRTEGRRRSISTRSIRTSSWRTAQQNSTREFRDGSAGAEWRVGVRLNSN
jgi:hypothetical protein